MALLPFPVQRNVSGMHVDRTYAYQFRGEKWVPASYCPCTALHHAAGKFQNTTLQPRLRATIHIRSCSGSTSAHRRSSGRIICSRGAVITCTCTGIYPYRWYLLLYRAHCTLHNRMGKHHRHAFDVVVDCTRAYSRTGTCTHAQGSTAWKYNRRRTMGICDRAGL